jgi:hypothetical protein
MSYEKIELYGDITKSLNQIISDTYLGDEISETKIVLSDDDNESHFDWCWDKTLENFKKENVIIKHGGELKDYFKSFFSDTFYLQTKKELRETIAKFLSEIFNTDMTYSKSDLDLLTELYKLMEKNVE